MQVFSVFYYHQPFLPMWMTAALIWFYLQVAYRRRHSLITSRQAAVELGWFHLGLVSSWWLGPLPYYVFLWNWLVQRIHQFSAVAVLKRLNIALATFMVASFVGHTVLDLQQGVERKVGRILPGPYSRQRLQDLLNSGQVSPQQASDWARNREGRLQSNARQMLSLEIRKP